MSFLFAHTPANLGGCVMGSLCLLGSLFTPCHAATSSFGGIQISSIQTQHLSGSLSFCQVRLPFTQRAIRLPWEANSSLKEAKFATITSKGRSGQFAAKWSDQGEQVSNGWVGVPWFFQSDENLVGHRPGRALHYFIMFFFLAELVVKKSSAQNRRWTRIPLPWLYFSARAHKLLYIAKLLVQ